MDSRPTAARFPAIDQREGPIQPGPTRWTPSGAPKARDQKLWEWRRESPIRPVVFEDPGTMDEEVVHLHLEQRVVQRLLGRFTAQGFVHHDLSRACLAQTTDAIPRVVLLGRLCLYGPRRPGCTRSSSPSPPAGPIPRSARNRSSPTPAKQRPGRSTCSTKPSCPAPPAPPPTRSCKQLQAAAPRDVSELLPHLQARGEDYARDARKLLLDRGAAESKAMSEILETQRKHIIDLVAQHSTTDRQLLLGFAEDELRQLESNRRHWDKRLLRLDDELKTEPGRIRDLYQVKATRIEPVGVVYLWPATG